MKNPTFLIRWMVGAVFLSEGLQKFIYPEILGVGRFAKIGIPAPNVMAPFVGIVEIVCGAAVIVGFRLQLLTIPLLIDMTVAILTTKVPLLVHQGFWAAAHESRVDYCMFLGLAFLFLTAQSKASH